MDVTLLNQIKKEYETASALVDTLLKSDSALLANSAKKQDVSDAFTALSAKIDTLPKKSDWTATICSYIDLLTTINTAGVIKSVQQGVYTTTGDITISPVNTAKAAVFLTNSVDGGIIGNCRYHLYSSFLRIYKDSTTYLATEGAWSVVEFY